MQSLTLRVLSLMLMTTLACSKQVTSSQDLGTLDAGGLDSGPIAGTGRCENLPCYTRIDSDVQWAQLGAPTSDTTRCDIDQYIHFVLPRSTNTALDAPLFVSPTFAPRLYPWLRASFSAFSTLSPEAYFTTFERTDMSDYYTGLIFRMQSPQGFAYGFSLSNYGYFGAELSESDVAGLKAQLSMHFELPLGYAPQQWSLAEAAKGFSTVDVFPPLPCETETCPDPNAHCLIIPAGRTACGRFSDDRDVQTEYRNKGQIEFLETAINYPASPGTYPMTLVSGGVFGPEKRRYSADGPGSLEVREYGGGRGLTFIYSQPLRAGNDEILFQFSDSGPNDSPSRTIMREPDWSLRETWAFATIDAENVVHFASCEYATLPRFYGQADLGGGDALFFEIRYEVPGGGSGPFSIMWGEITLGGTTVVVDDYFDLVYAGRHHNFDNQLWFLFKTPIQYQGHDVYGVGIDEADFGCCPAEIFTLDENLQPLDMLDSSRYERSPVSF